LNLRPTGANVIELEAVEVPGSVAGFFGQKERRENDMRLKPPVLVATLVLVLLGTFAWADQIVLKDGTVYSGKFVRGDVNVVEFRVLGRIESFKISDVAQIVFKEPELGDASSIRSSIRTPAQPLPPESPAPAAQERPLVSQTVPEQAQSAPPQAAGQVTQPQTGSGQGVTLPVGTPITIRTSTNIDTDRNRVGDVFDSTLDQPITWGDRTIFPRGTTVKGRIAYAKESGKLSGQSQLILELTELVANGKSYILRTSDYTEAGANRANRTAATVGGTAALGAIIGAIAGGGTGAAVGAASGAAVGTGVQVMTRGQVLKIPAETILEFRLQSPLPVDVP